MDRPIYIEKRHMECSKCERELPSGTTCYDYYGDIYCEICWEKFLEQLTKDCETEAEDGEVWSQLEHKTV